jgi:outer membrane lipoprotein LolB
VFRRLAGTLAAIVLSACASLSPPVAERHYAGRFALTSETLGADGAPQRENVSGRFVLASGAAQTTLDLASPLGTTLARLESSPAGARLQVPEDGALREVRDADAGSLAERVLGFPLPLAGLPWWIRGEPMPGRAVRRLNADALATFEQDGWRVSIDERFAAGAPRRMTLIRPAAAAAPAITLRVVLDDAAAVPAAVP